MIEVFLGMGWEVLVFGVTAMSAGIWSLYVSYNARKAEYEISLLRREFVKNKLALSKCQLISYANSTDTLEHYTNELNNMESE